METESEVDYTYNEMLANLSPNLLQPHYHRLLYLRNHFVSTVSPDLLVTCAKKLHPGISYPDRSVDPVLPHLTLPLEPLFSQLHPTGGVEYQSHIKCA